MENLELTDPHAFLKAEVWTLLEQVMDPEVGLDIVRMGLVYDLRYLQEENTIEVVMTLTSRGCPMGPMITQNASQLLQDHYPDKDIHIRLVWTPAWTVDRISEEGKQQLGWH